MRRSIEGLKNLKETLEPVLFNAPDEYRGLILTVYLSEEDMHTWEARKQIEVDLGIQPEQIVGGGRRYRVPILTPHLVDWDKSGFGDEARAHRGSYVREWAAEHPDLKTILIGNVFADPITKQQAMICIRPHAEQLVTSQTFDIFPRNLIDIELVREIPGYLTDGEKEAVAAWYKREREEN